MARQMKDSGIEWIGQIPENWKQYHFKYLINRKIDNRGRTPEINDNNEGTPIIELNAIGNKTPDVSKVTKYISDESYKKFIRNDLLAGDVLFGTVGSIGKCSIVPENANYCIAQNIVGYGFNKEQCSLYWYYYFSSEAFRLSFMQYNKGNVLSSIKISDMEMTTMVVPPLKEQQKIADFLDEKVGEIDNVIEATKATIEDYKKYKQSVITEAVTKGLNPDVAMKDSGIEWIGKIPEHWEITKVKFLYNIILGKMLCNEPKDETYTLENYLCSQNVKWNGIDTTTIKKMWFSEQEKSLYLLNEGDLVITEGGSIGESCIYKGEYAPCYIQNAVHKATGRGKNKNKLLYYWLQTLETVGYFKMICNRATIAHYTKEKVENTPIIHIPQDEQEEIVNYLDKKCTEIDNLISAKEQLIADMESYKKSLIYEYVTGKKEVLDNE